MQEIYTAYERALNSPYLAHRHHLRRHQLDFTDDQILTLLHATEHEVDEDIRPASVRRVRDAILHANHIDGGIGEQKLQGVVEALEGLVGRDFAIS